MAIPGVGERFPDFHLNGFDSAKVRSAKPLLLILWKIGCSTSRLTVPFFDRIQDAYPGAAIVGVAQENGPALSAFAKERGLNFQQLADADLAISRQYGLEVVPSYLLTDSSGQILEAALGWDRVKIEGIGKRLAEMLGTVVKPIVRPEDGMPDFTPG